MNDHDDTQRDIQPEKQSLSNKEQGQSHSADSAPEDVRTRNLSRRLPASPLPAQTKGDLSTWDERLQARRVHIKRRVIHERIKRRIEGHRKVVSRLVIVLGVVLGTFLTLFSGTLG